MLDDGQQLSKQTLPGHRSRNSTTKTSKEFESEPRSFKTKGGKRVRGNEHDKGTSDERHGVKERKQGQPEKKRRRLSVVDSSATNVQGIGKSKEAEEKEQSKAGQKLGSIIGRKRKERRERKGKGTKGKGKT